MPVGIMPEGYFHKRLKKRPVNISENISDEPEDLSIKHDIIHRLLSPIQSPEKLQTTPNIPIQYPSFYPDVLESLHRSFLKESSGSYHMCLKCGKTYSTTLGLQKHQQICLLESTTPKPYNCKICEKIYNTSSALKLHVKTHTLPHKCQLCEKSFSRPWLLQGHLRTHTGERPFSCKQCDKAFADRSNLRAHMQTHEKVKKYSCSRCNKSFSRKSVLEKHVKRDCLG
ncbi:unnamed protein product [Brassicogethes aeneus]|uniref:C2H2-type domain-containing protein n=1 Tax=Brassicogethes aeneus TaxID=1431903 RepID=A0A9P0B6N7_BRAAE|nr:unnamed protein product [Brassicogethes aeneus]